MALGMEMMVTNVLKNMGFDADALKVHAVAVVEKVNGFDTRLSNIEKLLLAQNAKLDIIIQHQNTNVSGIEPVAEVDLDNIPTQGIFERGGSDFGNIRQTHQDELEEVELKPE